MKKIRNGVGYFFLIIVFLLILKLNSFGFFYLYDPDARASAMGGAFYSVSGDPACIFYNPAGIATIKDLQFSLTINSQEYECDKNMFPDTYMRPGQPRLLIQLRSIFPQRMYQLFRMNRAITYCMRFPFHTL